VDSVVSGVGVGTLGTCAGEGIGVGWRTPRVAPCKATLSPRADGGLPKAYRLASTATELVVALDTRNKLSFVPSPISFHSLNPIAPMMTAPTIKAPRARRIRPYLAG